MKLLDVLAFREIVLISMFLVIPAAIIFYFALYKKDDRECMTWDEKKENFKIIAFVAAIPIIIILVILQCS